MINKYHFIAIGGVGMSGLAKYLIQQGYEVSGSDISESKYVMKLKDLGAKIFIGHAKENVPKDAIIVVSSVIRESNPELIQAKALKCPIYHRSDLLAEISRNSKKLFIGFAGTHGKTTTSGMTSYVLSKAGLKPSFVVGGIIPSLETNAEFDKGNHFIAEMDESDGTLVKYRPDIAVINNLEADHLDFYKKGLESVLETFQQFMSNLKPNAKILINNDNSGNLKLKGYDFVTFGLDAAEYMAKNVEFHNGYTTFDVTHNDEMLLENVTIKIPGTHNVYNTLAVIAACNESGVDVNLLKEHFATFKGMGRRFQKMLDIGEVPVYDDYAHHPTEIKATLSAMKSFTGRHIVAVFQPHRYTRLKSLWNDFKTAVSCADRIIITDVYAASEDPIEGINSEKFAAEIDKAEYVSGSISDVAKKILPTIKNDDVVIGLGAGTITNLAKSLKSAKEENS